MSLSLLACAEIIRILNTPVSFNVSQHSSSAYPTRLPVLEPRPGEQVSTLSPVAHAASAAFGVHVEQDSELGRKEMV